MTGVLIVIIIALLFLLYLMWPTRLLSTIVFMQKEINKLTESNIDMQNKLDELMDYKRKG